MTTHEQFLDAAKHGDATLIAELLQQDASLISKTDECGLTALHQAVCADYQAFTPGHLQTVELLLRNGAPVESRGEAGNIGACTPLHLAAFSGADRVEAVRLLLAHGADPNVISSQHSTPLSTAAAHKEWDICDSLIAAGAMVTFHDAVALDMIERVRSLLAEDGSLVNSPHPYDGFTPLASARTTAMRELLMAHGCRPGLAEASMLGLHERVRELVAASPSVVHERHQSGRTALHFAAEGGHVDVAEFLLCSGADIHAEWTPGPHWTPLAVARKRRQPTMADWLVAHGAQK